MNENENTAYQYQNPEDQEESELNAPPQNPSMQPGNQKLQTSTMKSMEMGAIFQRIEDAHSRTHAFQVLILIGLIWLIVLLTKILKAIRGSKKH